MSLTLHRDMHSGKTKCPVCERAFSRVHDMRTHVQKKHFKMTMNIDASTASIVATTTTTTTTTKPDDTPGVSTISLSGTTRNLIDDPLSSSGANNTMSACHSSKADTNDLLPSTEDRISVKVSHSVSDNTSEDNLIIMTANK